MRSDLDAIRARTVLREAHLEAARLVPEFNASPRAKVLERPAPREPIAMNDVFVRDLFRSRPGTDEGGF